MANIWYSTPKMTPLTISLLQPISNLSGIGVSTIPNHRGPHQNPKMATHTPKNNCFPSIFVFGANIRYSIPKRTPLAISLLQRISNLSGIGVSTILNHWGPHQTPKWPLIHPKNNVSLAYLFLGLISGTPPQKGPP